MRPEIWAFLGVVVTALGSVLVAMVSISGRTKRIEQHTEKTGNGFAPEVLSQLRELRHCMESMHNRLTILERKRWWHR